MVPSQRQQQTSEGGSETLSVCQPSRTCFSSLWWPCYDVCLRIHLTPSRCESWIRVCVCVCMQSFEGTPFPLVTLGVELIFVVLEVGVGVSTVGSQEAGNSSDDSIFLPCASPPSTFHRKEGGTHTYCKHTQTQRLSSPAGHGHGDFDRLLAEHPPGCRTVSTPSPSTPSLAPLSHTLLSRVPPSRALLLHLCFVFASCLLRVHRSSSDRESQTDIQMAWKLPSCWLISSLAGRDASSCSFSHS